MKKIMKRIMALMLSLVMMLGCIPSFVNEVDAEEDAYIFTIGGVEEDGYIKNMTVSFGGVSTQFEKRDSYSRQFRYKYGEDVPGGYYDFSSLLDEYYIDGSNYKPDYQSTSEDSVFMIKDSNLKERVYCVQIYLLADKTKDPTNPSATTFDTSKPVKIVTAPGCSIESVELVKTDNYTSDFEDKYYLTETSLHAYFKLKLKDNSNKIDISGIEDGCEKDDITLNELVMTDKEGEKYTVKLTEAGIYPNKNGSPYTGTLSKDEDYYLYITTDSYTDFEPAVPDLTESTFDYNIDDFVLTVNDGSTPDWDVYIKSLGHTNIGIDFRINLDSKTLKSATLSPSGTLQGGDTNPTLKFTTNNANYVSSENTEAGTWTQMNGDPVVTFEKGTWYKKVITLTAQGTKEWSDNINNDHKEYIGLSSDYGIVTDITKVDSKNLQVTIKYQATGIISTINYEEKEPTTLKELKDLNSDSFITPGLTSFQFAVIDLKKDVTEDEQDRGIILLKMTSTYSNEAKRDTVEQVKYLSTNVMTENNKTDSDNFGIFLRTHDYGWYKEDTTKIVVYKKFDLRKTENITFTYAPETTVSNVLASVNLSSGTLDGGYIYPIVDDVTQIEPLQNGDKLELGKKYKLVIRIVDRDNGQLYTTLKINDTTATHIDDITLQSDGWNRGNNYLDVCYTFECKNQSSGGGHKKKKTEEPKQEDPKTLEEKLQDELKKDDVKKANSNEGEKINPSAKYINGYDDGSFKPNNKVNNIELMSMVTELFDNVEIKETKDLNQGKDYWGQEIIDKANALGLIPGNKNNKKYNLSDEVTRGDLAVVVYNLVKDYTDAPSLKDRNNCKDAIGKNYEKEAAKLLELGIFKGYDDGMFHGDYTLTRAEAVVVINRALKSLGFEIKMPSIKLSFPDLSKEHWAYAEIMYAANK